MKSHCRLTSRVEQEPISSSDVERYQTVYATANGSVAAPTAGLHFTNQLLEQIRSMGVRVCEVSLHVGLGTFAPVKSRNISDHVMHEERYEITAETAAAINAAKGSVVACSPSGPLPCVFWNPLR